MNYTNNNVKTPYELWYNVKPNIKHLHVWWCDVYYYHHQEKRKHKLDETENASEQVATGAHLLAPVPINETAEERISTSENGSPQVATGVHQFGDNMIEFLKKQIDIKDQQIAVKDQQIGAMLERDRETNVLIHGLQTSLTQVVHALPHPKRDEGNSPLHDGRG